MPVSLVFGASGAIGRFLLPRLIAAGHDVVAVSREPRTSKHSGLRWIVGGFPERIPALQPCDSIFSLGPLDAFAQWFAQTRMDARSRIVAIGSLSAETKHASADPSERALAERLIAAERTLAAVAAARGCAATVVRATLIYGAGLDRTLTPIVDLARRLRVFPYVRACGLRQPVHADDLAAACMRLSVLPGAPLDIYSVGGGERLAFATMLQRARDSLPFATLALPIPGVLARAGVGVARRLPAFRAASAAAISRMNQNLVVDHSAASADFGWSPRGFRPDAHAWKVPPLP